MNIAQQMNICTTGEYSIATTTKMAPVIDIGKYLLPASKRRPVANMESIIIIIINYCFDRLYL